MFNFKKMKKNSPRVSLVDTIDFSNDENEIKNNNNEEVDEDLCVKYCDDNIKEIALDLPIFAVHVWERACTVRYYVNEESFSVDELNKEKYIDQFDNEMIENPVSYLIECFDSAIKSWEIINQPDFIKLERTFHLLDSDFVIEYSSSEHEQNISSFLPGEHNSTLKIHQMYYKNDNELSLDKRILTKILSHHIGHMFGLMHYYSIEYDKDNKIVMVADNVKEESVMRYNKSVSSLEVSKQDIYMLNLLYKYKGIYPSILLKNNKGNTEFVEINVNAPISKQLPNNLLGYIEDDFDIGFDKTKEIINIIGYNQWKILTNTLSLFNNNNSNKFNKMILVTLFDFTEEFLEETPLIILNHFDSFEKQLLIIQLFYENTFKKYKKEIKEFIKKNSI